MEIRPGTSNYQIKGNTSSNDSLKTVFTSSKINTSNIAKAQEDSLVECDISIDSGNNEAADILNKEYFQTINEYYKQQIELSELEQTRNLLKNQIENYSNDDKTPKDTLEAQLSSLDFSITNLKLNIKACEDSMRSLNIEILNIALNNSSNEFNFLPPSTAHSIGNNFSLFQDDADNSVYENKIISNDIANRLDNKLGSGFTQKCETIAKKLNCNAADLISMMYSESGLNPGAKNELSGSAGLIQFMPSTLAANGYSPERVADMPAIEQLDVVSDILLEFKAMSGFSASDKLDAGSLYAICFLPAAAKNEVLCSSTGSLNWAYSANSALDLNSDGSISKSDLANRLNDKYKEMCNTI